MDTPWKIEILPSAQRELAGMDDRVRHDAMQAILDLTEDPFPDGSLLLEGHTDLYRIYCYRSRYRIVYRVSEKQHRVIATRVRPRGTAYQGL